MNFITSYFSGPASRLSLDAATSLTTVSDTPTHPARCNICLDDLPISQFLALECGHAFCSRCLRLHLATYQPSCPECRGPIDGTRTPRPVYFNMMPCDQALELGTASVCAKVVEHAGRAKDSLEFLGTDSADDAFESGLRRAREALVMMESVSAAKSAVNDVTTVVNDCMLLLLALLQSYRHAHQGVEDALQVAESERDAFLEQFQSNVLRVTVEDLRSRMGDLEDELEAATTERDAALREARSLRAEHAALRRQSGPARASTVDSEALRALRLENNGLVARVADTRALSDRLEQVEEQNRELKAENEELASLLDAKNRYLDDREAELARVRTDNDALTSRLKASESRVERRDQEIANLQLANENFRKQGSSLATYMERLEEESHTLRARGEDMRRTQSENDELRSRTPLPVQSVDTKTHARLQSTKDKLRRAKDDLRLAASDNQQLRARVFALEEQRRAALIDAESRKDRERRLAADVQRAHEGVFRLRGENAELRVQVGMLNSRFRALEASEGETTPYDRNGLAPPTPISTLPASLLRSPRTMRSVLPLSRHVPLEESSRRRVSVAQTPRRDSEQPQSMAILPSRRTVVQDVDGQGPARAGSSVSINASRK